MKSETDKNTRKTRDFNTPRSILDRSSRLKSQQETQAYHILVCFTTLHFADIAFLTNC